MANKGMILVTKNGETREMGLIQWKRLREMPDGSHEGWREVPPGTSIGDAATFNPPEIHLPTPAPPALGVTDKKEEEPNSDFSGVNGPGNSPPAAGSKSKVKSSPNKKSK